MQKKFCTCPRQKGSWRLILQRGAFGILDRAIGRNARDSRCSSVLYPTKYQTPTRTSSTENSSPKANIGMQATLFTVVGPMSGRVRFLDDMHRQRTRTHPPTRLKCQHATRGCTAWALCRWLPPHRDSGPVSTRARLQWEKCLKEPMEKRNNRMDRTLPPAQR